MCLTQCQLGKDKRLQKRDGGMTCDMPFSSVYKTTFEVVCVTEDKTQTRSGIKVNKVE